jgi:TPR repeat protein
MIPRDSLGAPLGSGDPPACFRYDHPDTSQVLAVKYIDRTTGTETGDPQVVLQKLSEIVHPNILPIVSFAADTENLCIASPFCPKGDLGTLLQSLLSGSAPEGWTSTTALIILYGIAQGLKCLHDLNLGHHDLIPGNVILNDNCEVLLTDYQMARVFEDIREPHYSNKTNIAFLSPEYCNGIPEEISGDIYSFGIIMYCLLKNALPFTAAERGAPRKWLQVIKSKRPDLSGLPSLTQEFLEKCWSRDVKARPTIADVIQFLEEHAADLGFPDVDIGEFAKYRNAGKTGDELKCLVELADKGDPTSMFFIGLKYETGSGVKADEAQAVEWFRRSAESGSQFGQVKYAIFLHFTENKIVDAARYYELAAKQDNPDALNNLAALIESGDLPGGYPSAFDFFRRAADLGHPSAQVNLGRYFELGRVVAKNVQQAANYYRRAAESGDPQGQINYDRVTGARPVIAASGGSSEHVATGISAIEKGDYLQAANSFKLAADLDDPVGTFNLGFLADKGYIDGHDAAALYRKAIALGSVPAKTNLARLIIYDDPTAAATLLREASAANDPYAAYNLALAIERNLIPSDLTESRELYKTAAGAGLAEAMQSYGNVLELGIGGPIDIEQARIHYQRATDTSNGRLTDSAVAIARLSA